MMELSDKVADTLQCIDLLKSSLARCYRTGMGYRDKCRAYMGLGCAPFRREGGLWGRCPIVGNTRPKVLTNGQKDRLSSGNLRKGLKPGRALIATRVRRKGIRAFPGYRQTLWG